jgi:ATP-binding cassette subfamily B protein
MRPVYKKSRETYADLTHRIQENVQGIKVVKSFAREEYETDLFKNHNDEYYEDSMDIIKLQATFDPVIYLLDNIAFLVVLLVGGLFVIDGVMTFGDLFAFVLVMNFSIEPLYFITRFLGNMPQITETSKRLTNILNSEIIVKEKQDAKELPPIKGEIEFKNVSFSFNSKSDYYVLKDINLKVKPGETIAILGATGSGKSALVKLIPRFYDVDKGEILIDGTNIKDVTFNSLRKQIGFVSQERHLFSRSIRDNIAFGNREIPFNDVKYAARVSNIDEFIEQELPKEYQTKVGERGTTLSGGQKQRVAIARAFAIKPKILILDDATSAIDSDYEYKIFQRMKNDLKNTTTFIITQRISTVKYADKIIVLKDGKILQEGTHEELIENKQAMYYKLYSTIKR